VIEDDVVVRVLPDLLLDPVVHCGRSAASSSPSNSTVHRPVPSMRVNRSADT
jgi:hypothetical protein